MRLARARQSDKVSEWQVRNRHTDRACSRIFNNAGTLALCRTWIRAGVKSPCEPVRRSGTINGVDTKLIEKTAKALLAASPAGSQVILFGSRARGDANAQSDADFLVIQPQARSRLSEAARLARVIRPLRVPADIVVIGRDEFEEWKDTPNNVFYYAHHEGRLIA